MTDTYIDRETSKIFGDRLIIHRRDDVSGDIYYFRAKVLEGKGYIRRSCKTDNALKAMMFAEQAYQDLLVRARGGYSLHDITVDKFFDAWIVNQRQRLTETRWKWKRSVYDRYLKEFMGGKRLADLTSKVIDGYWEFRLAYWQRPDARVRIEVNANRVTARTKSSRNIAVNPSFATLKAEASLINEILRAAVDEGHLTRTIKISAQDAIPKNQRTQGFRDTFEDDEWRVLTRNLYNYAHCLGKYSGGRVHRGHVFQRRMLHAFVLLAAATGLRVGELKQLRWKDLEFGQLSNEKGEEVLSVIVRAETSKVRRDRKTVSYDSHFIGVMERFRELSPRNKGSDLIFFVERQGRVEFVDLGNAFKNFLRTCEFEGREKGLLMSDAGKVRTLYSLRHFYAIQRLKRGTDIWSLVEAMGTGVAQIRNHYGRHISGDSYVEQLTKWNDTGRRKKLRSEVQNLVSMVADRRLSKEAAFEVFSRIYDEYDA